MEQLVTVERNTAKVLLLDPDPDTCEMYAIHLTNSGYDVRTAESAASALAAVRTDAPHLVVTEIMLPDMSGPEVCRRIRALAGSENLPIIALSGLTARYFDPECFTEILLKPCPPDHLRVVVQKHLRGRG